MASNSELKELIKLIGDSEVVASDLADGFNFSDLVGLIAFARDLPPVLQDPELLFPEWVALDDASQADLVAYAQNECKFPKNMNVEAWVQKVVSALVFLSSIIAIFVKK